MDLILFITPDGLDGGPVWGRRIGAARTDPSHPLASGANLESAVRSHIPSTDEQN